MISLPHGFAEQASALKTLRGREGSELRRELCRGFAISAPTLSRWLRQIGIRDRVRNSDPTTRAGYATDEEMHAVLALQWSSYTQDRGLLMSDEDAIELAIDNRKLRPDVLSLYSYRAWKKAQGVSQTQMRGAAWRPDGTVSPDEHVELRSLGPNHVWQVDFSLARNWKVKNTKIVYDETAYKGKDLKFDELRILRFVVIDHTSGQIYCRYFLGRGESTTIFLEGLYWAMAEKRLHSGEVISDKYPFEGVPQILTMDRGSFAKTNATEAVVERLGVRPIIAMTARAKGAVESTMNLWERRFEASFRIDPFHSIEELNDEALHRAALINADRPHSRHGMTRRAFWLAYINSCEEARLRRLSCTLEEFKRIALSEPETRRVAGDLTISFKGETYRVPDALRGERTVELVFSVFDYPRIQLRVPGALERYYADPIERDAAGFPVDAPVIGSEFKSHKKSSKVAAVEAAKAVVNGWTPGEIVARGNDLAKVGPTAAPGVKAMPLRAEQVEIEPAAPATFRKVAARQQLQAALQRPFSEPEKAYLAAWPEEVTQQQIDDAVVEFERGLTARVIAFERRESR